MPKTARRILKGKRYRGGLEGRLDLIGVGLFCIAVLMAVLFAVETHLEGWWVCLLQIVSGVVTWTLFRAIAEHLRLQKKNAGLPYGGKISSNSEEPLYLCSACQVQVDTPYYCYRCHSDLIDETPDAVQATPPADEP